MAGAGRSPLASRHQPGLVQGHKEGRGRFPAGHRPTKQLGHISTHWGTVPGAPSLKWNTRNWRASIACRPAMYSCQAMAPKPSSAGLTASMSVGTPGRARFRQPGARPRSTSLVVTRQRPSPTSSGRPQNSA
eukprot:224225-Chlamydomonas_euryale.AAC.1